MSEAGVAKLERTLAIERELSTADDYARWTTSQTDRIYALLCKQFPEVVVVRNAHIIYALDGSCPVFTSVCLPAVEANRLGTCEAVETLRRQYAEMKQSMQNGA